jgi:hypothetical protein
METRFGQNRRTVALLAAIIAGTVLVLLPRPGPATNSTTPVAAGSMVPLTAAWPDAKVVTYGGRLGDGTEFTPRLHLDPTAVVGTALAKDGLAVRVLLRTATSVREIHRVPNSSYPEFAGFSVRGDTVVWAERTYPHGAVPLTQLWRANWERTSEAELVTADAGGAVFFQSQYDIQFVDDRLYWASTQDTAVASTQIRSVPLAGGAVTIQEVPGTFALSAWPWLVTPYGARRDQVQLLNLSTGQQLSVAQTPGELTQCGMTWCRIGVTGVRSLIRTDIMRPDGTGRRRIASGDCIPVINDVALLDRFEVFTVDGAAGSGGPQSRLLLYDITMDRTVVVAAGVVEANSLGGFLWWATGPEGSYHWSVIDLRTLPA